MGAILESSPRGYDKARDFSRPINLDHRTGHQSPVDLKRFLAPFSPPTTSLIDALRYWTEQQPQEAAFYFTDGEAAETSVTYEELDRHARAIAARLLGQAGSEVS